MFVARAFVRHFYAKLEQLFSRALGQVRRIRGEQGRRAFDEDYACLRWIDVAKVFGECEARDFRDRTRHFNTGWAPPMITKVIAALRAGSSSIFSAYSNAKRIRLP